MTTTTTTNNRGRLFFAALFVLNSIYASSSGHRRDRLWANAASVAATPLARSPRSHPSASSTATTDDGEARRDDDGGGGGGKLVDPSTTTSSIIGASSASSSSHQPSSSSKHRDPYVSASPLSAAAVCRDGIALVSLHYDVDLVVVDRATADDGKDDVASSNSSDEGNKTVSAIEEEEHRRRGPFRDLPLSSRGPLRIESVHEASSSRSMSPPPPVSLLTAGWRTDGMALADAARELTAEEARLYCLPYLAMQQGGGTTTAGGDYDDRHGVEGGGDDDDGPDRPLLEGEHANVGKAAMMTRDEISVPSHDDDARGTAERTSSSRYGRRIADGLSYHLAKCAFSEGVRSLSCVGLLACGGGSLRLVDATGSHRVRAHAIGDGSSALHVRMARIDFGTMDCREGLRTLLNLIAEEGDEGGGGGASSSLVDLSCRNGGEEMELPPDGNGAEEENGFQSSRDVETSSSDGGSSVMAKPAFVHGGNHGDDRQTHNEEEQKQFITTVPSTTATMQHQTQPRKWNIPPNTAVELAVMKSDEGRMRRVRLSSLFCENRHSPFC